MAAQIGDSKIDKPLKFRGFIVLFAVRTGMISPPSGGSIGPFHPEVIWPNENKNAADAAFNVF